MTSTPTRDGERSVLAVGMAVLGALALPAGVDVVRAWSDASIGSKIYGALSLAGGATAVILPAWSWRRPAAVPTWRPAALGIFGALTLNQFAGLIGGTILCHSPG
jgi:hypothetical protein